MFAIDRLLSRYDQMGPHRTGAEQDEEVAQWLAEALAGLGLEVVTQPFSLQVIVDHCCQLQIGTEQFELMPCHDSRLPECLELQAQVVTRPTQGIQVVQSSTMGYAQLTETRESCRAAAMIVITMGSRPGLTPPNAEHFEAPLQVPTFFISGEQRGRLLALVEQGLTATLQSRVIRQPGCSSNIVAIKHGSRGDLSPIVVFTPRTGWWHCASERGGGLAAMVNLARALRDTDVERTVILAVTSGHELGYLGMKRLVREVLPADAHLWVHLGANFSARHDPLFFVQASNAMIEQAFLHALNAEGVEPDIIAPRGGPLSGEGEHIPRQANYLSLQGGNALFHHPEDRFPDAVDIPKLASICQALKRFVLEQATADRQKEA